MVVAAEVGRHGSKIVGEAVKWNPNGRITANARFLHPRPCASCYQSTFDFSRAAKGLCG